MKNTVKWSGLGFAFIAIASLTSFAAAAPAEAAPTIVADMGNTGSSALELAAGNASDAITRPARVGERVWEFQFHTRQSCLNRKGYIDRNQPWLRTTRCSTSPEANGRYWLYVENDCTDRIDPTRGDLTADRRVARLEAPTSLVTNS